MPITSFEQITLSLPQLTRTQLEQVKTRCNFLLKNKTGKSLENEDWVLSGILKELERRGIWSDHGFRIKSHKSFASFNTKSLKVRELLEKAAPGMNLTERYYLGEVAAKELASYITWRDTSLNLLLEQVHLIPIALMKAFPGYMESAMLGVVVRQSLE